MTRKFDTQYKTKRLDNLGDPSWHDRRWDDIDQRMHQRELDAGKIDDVADNLADIAIARLETGFEPVVNSIREKLHQFGASFRATSSSLVTLAPEYANYVFTLTPETRDSFVVTNCVTVYPAGNYTIFVTAKTLSYTRATGVLELETITSFGSGVFSSWEIAATSEPSLDDHASRTDNPHQTTAAQLQCYTATESLASITTLIQSRFSQLIGTAPPNLDTIGELAAAIGSNPNFATATQTALDARVRVDIPVVYTEGQKAQIASNLDILRTAQLDAFGLLEPHGRLSASNIPFPKSTLSTNQIYYVPTIGTRWPIWDGTKFVMRDFGATALMLDMSDATKSPAAGRKNAVYDIFGWMDGATPRISRGPSWIKTTAVTSISTTSPAVVNAPSHGLKAGDPINITGTTPAGIGGEYLVSRVIDGNSFNIAINWANACAGVYANSTIGGGGADMNVHCYTLARNVGAGSSELEYPSTASPRLAVNKYAITNGPAARAGLFLGTIATDYLAPSVAWGWGSTAVACSFQLANAHNKRLVRTSMYPSSGNWTINTPPGARRVNFARAFEINFVCCDNEEVTRALYTTHMITTGNVFYHISFATSLVAFQQPSYTAGGIAGASWQLQVPYLARHLPGRQVVGLIEGVSTGGVDVTISGDSYTILSYEGWH